jgi:hypothetical protein
VYVSVSKALPLALAFYTILSPLPIRLAPTLEFDHEFPKRGMEVSTFRYLMLFEVRVPL